MSIQYSIDYNEDYFKVAGATSTADNGNGTMDITIAPGASATLTMHFSMHMPPDTYSGVRFDSITVSYVIESGSLQSITQALSIYFYSFASAPETQNVALNDPVPAWNLSTGADATSILTPSVFSVLAAVSYDTFTLTFTAASGGTPAVIMIRPINVKFTWVPPP